MQTVDDEIMDIRKDLATMSVSIKLLLDVILKNVVLPAGVREEIVSNLQNFESRLANYEDSLYQGRIRDLLIQSLGAAGFPPDFLDSPPE